MITPGSVNPLLLASGDTTTPCGGSIPTPSYVIKNSLRFRKSASANLNKTLPSTSSRRRWTVSTWVKLGALNSQFYIMCGISAMAQNGLRTYIRLNDDGHLYTEQGNIQINTHYSLTSNRVFRDPSAWYHLVCVFDSDNATASERVRIWVNGVRETLTGTFANQNVDSAIDYSWDHFIGRMWDSRLGDFWTDGYFADYKFISDTALDASAFGEFDSFNGVWQPKTYAGAYGTNGFWLKFDDAAQIGKDSSGNNNHWTANNIDVAAPGTQATYDLMKDSPVMFDDGTPNPPGNYATWNPLSVLNSPTISNANLRITNPDASAWRVTKSTMRPSLGGKYYIELTSHTNFTANSYSYIGLATPTNTDPSSANIANIQTSTTAGEVLGITIDRVAHEIKTYSNNVLIQTVTGVTINELDIQVGSWYAEATVNFGQRPFKYAPPAGFKALCTTNLPTPSITNGKQHFDIALGAGAGILAQAQALTAKDLIWIKDRANSNNHQLIDVVRGANALHSNDTLAESAYVAPSGNSVAWAWKAGGAAVNNTDGSIASQVSVNKCAGFSIVTYTGAGGAKTVGHGLGAKPNMIFVKDRLDGAAQWVVYHSDLGATKGMYLNGTGSAGASPAWWNNTEPTSTVFTVNTSTDVNVNTHSLVAYCWTAIPGMSAFGSYTGNGSADGVFCYLGFKPRFLLMKRTDGAGNWYLYDTSRSTYNTTNSWLQPDTTAAENSSTTWEFDLLSNGFKIRNSGAFSNGSGAKYLYAAFCEHPFKIANAR